MSSHSEETEYAEAVAALYRLGFELHNSKQKFGTADMRRFCAALGSPEQRFPSILIAGTNGKGSTAATLASMLRVAGYRTGLYTSPHFRRLNERIRVDGAAVDDAAFAAGYRQVESCAQQLLAQKTIAQHPTFFEMVTAIAFVHFAHASVDVAVLEVGLGGRLDATNVVEPQLSIITDIDLDHQAFLGDTREKIAREKAGIMRATRPVITLPQCDEVNATLRDEAVRQSAMAVSAEPYWQALRGAGVADDAAAATSGEILRALRAGAEIRPALAGEHQWRNLALALAAADCLRKVGFTISFEQAACGVRQTRWPGRFQVIAADRARRRPEMVLDSAHNPAGAVALRQALQQRYAERPLVLLFAAMRDKNYAAVEQILFPLTAEIVVTEVRSNPRTAQVAELQAAAGDLGKTVHVAEDAAAALRLTCDVAQKLDAVIVVAGSMYLLSEVMDELDLAV